MKQPAGLAALTEFEQENNLGFPILDDASGIAAAAFGIGWTPECLRELFEQFSADWTGFNPEVAAIVPVVPKPRSEGCGCEPMSACVSSKRG